MPMAAIWAYLERLPALLAAERLEMAAVVSLPHLRDRDRRAVLRRWQHEMMGQATNVKARVTRASLAAVGIKFSVVSD